MRHKKLKLCAVILWGLGLTGLQAQESINATGGNAFSQLNKRIHKFKTSEIPSFSGHALTLSVFKSGYLQNKPTLDSIIYHGNDNNNELWIPYLKEIYNYEIGNTTSLYYKDYWNSFETNEWKSSKVEITFNNRKDIVSEIHSSLKNGEFVVLETQQYFYNSTGLLTEHIGGTYDSGTMVGQSREVYEYDENNYVKWMLQYYRDNENQSWRYYHKVGYEYNSDGKVIKEAMTDYDRNHDGLVNQLDWTQTLYAYDESGNLTTVESQSWSEETNDWEVKVRTDYTYNNVGQTLNEKIYTLNEQSGELELFINDSWLYDANGNGTAYYFREKDYDTDEWYTFKDSVIYDLGAMVKDYTMPYEFDFDCINKPLEERYYDLIESKWVLVEQDNFYYSDDVHTLAANVTSPKITVSQNSNFFSASWDSNIEHITLDVFNLSGKKVYCNQIKNKETLYLDFLTNGIYLYKIYNENLVVTGKLLVANSN